MSFDDEIAEEFEDVWSAIQRITYILEDMQIAIHDLQTQAGPMGEGCTGDRGREGSGGVS